MNEDLKSRHPALERWLTAEAAGDAAAEAELAALFTALPRLEPPPGFARRVLTAARGEAPGPAAEASPWRWLAVAALLLVSLTTAVLGTFALRAAETLTGVFRLPSPVSLAADGLAALVGGLADGLVLVAELPRWLRVAVAAAETPAVMLASVALLLAAAVGFRVLQRVLDRERSWSHVEFMG